MKKIFAAIILSMFFCCVSIKADILTADKPLNFSFSSSEQSIEVEFDHPGSRFLAIAVNFSEESSPEGSFRIKGTSNISAGQVTWESIFERDVFVHNGPVSIIDQIKPLKGRWKFQLFNAEKQVSGNISIVDQGPAPTIEFSEKTGAIQIVNPSDTNITAYGSVSHPDFPFTANEFNGSVTAEGDLIIPLPAGFYSLSHPAQTVNTMQAHMIPVHPGRITRIENWPTAPNPENVIKSEKENDAQANLNQKTLKLRSARLINDDQVQMRFVTPNWQGIVAKEELKA